MAVTIRLRRIGRKKQPSYRMVVTDKAAPRDGAYLDVVGFYNPRQKPAELRVDLEKVEAWVGKGASLSDTAASLVRKARNGGDRTVRLVPMGIDTAALRTSAGSSAPAQAAAPKAEAPAAEETPVTAEAPAAEETPVTAEAAEEVLESASAEEGGPDEA